MDISEFVPPPPPLRKGFPVMPARHSFSVPNISSTSTSSITSLANSPATSNPDLTPDSANTTSMLMTTLSGSSDMSLAAREKLMRTMTTNRVSDMKPVPMPSFSKLDIATTAQRQNQSLGAAPSNEQFYQKRSFTDIPVTATDLLRITLRSSKQPPDCAASDSNPVTSAIMPPLPPVPPRTIRRKPPPMPTMQTTSTTSLKSNQSTTPSGGWKSGYLAAINPHIIDIQPNDVKLKQTPNSSPEKQKTHLPVPLHHIDSSSNDSMELSQTSIASCSGGDRRGSSLTQLEPAGRRRSLMTTHRPSVSMGDTQLEVDLADILDGTRKLSLDGKGGVKYEVDGCVCAHEYGFVLMATKISADQKKKKKVYIKMINKETDCYKLAQKYVNPEHTELALMTSEKKKAKHLPEYVEHYMEPDYLIIVTKTHGIKKKTVNPLADKYQEVQWVYWFNQAV